MDTCIQEINLLTTGFDTEDRITTFALNLSPSICSS